MMVMSTIPEVNEIMTETYSQQVMIICETQLHNAPWLFENEGWDKSRLKAAVALVLDGKVVEQADGWRVAGSATFYLIPRATLTCPCKAAAHGKTTVCKHRVAVELFRRVQRAYPQSLPALPQTPMLDPDDDDALGNGYPLDDETLPLPLPPMTVDARLAQADRVARDHVYDALPTPQEDRMPPDAEYIPEPEVVTSAVMEPKNGMSHDTPLATPLASALVQWSAQRQVVKEFLRRELHAGVDYYALQIKGRDTKPVLSKAGSEKVLGLLQLAAHFALDEATWTMLGKPEGTLCYVCTLTTSGGHIVGEGRGARRLTQDGGDLNKTIKMAQKSAQVDAVLRTGALSDCFTQDLEDDAPPAAPGKSQDLRSQIWAIIKQRAPAVQGREEAARWIMEHTKLELHPDNYQAILTKLEGR